MAESDRHLTDIRFAILDAMADDAEDVEQIYLSANRGGLAKVPFKVRFQLHVLMDEMVRMLKDGYIEAKYSNDQSVAPLAPAPVNPAFLHYYWFVPTGKGRAAWETYPDYKNEPGTQ